MFDIGWTELLVIAVVAIIIVGPKDLPRMLRTLGRYASKLKRTAGEFRAQFDDALRESEFDELRNSMRDMTDMKPLDDIKQEVNQGLEPLRTTADSIKKGVEDTAPGNADRTKDAPAPSASGAEADSTPESKKAEPAAGAKSGAAAKTASTTAAAAKAKPAKTPPGSGAAPKTGV